VRGAQGWRWQALGAYNSVSSHHALGACVSRQNPADFVHKMFELRPKNTEEKVSGTFFLLTNIKNDSATIPIR
jgi:hypothetical protein